MKLITQALGAFGCLPKCDLFLCTSGHIGVSDRCFSGSGDLEHLTRPSPDEEPGDQGCSKRQERGVGVSFPLIEEQVRTRSMCAPRSSDGTPILHSSPRTDRQCAIEYCGIGSGRSGSGDVHTPLSAFSLFERLRGMRRLCLMSK